VEFALQATSEAPEAGVSGAEKIDKLLAATGTRRYPTMGTTQARHLVPNTIASSLPVEQTPRGRRLRREDTEDVPIQPLVLGR